MTRQPTEHSRLAGSAATHRTLSATYHRLRVLGFDESEAGNLTAYLSGIPLCAVSWTVREVAHLIFLRELRRVSRRWSDAEDRADSADRTPASAIAQRVPASGFDDGAPASAGPSTPRGGADRSDGRVTLLTLFRSMAGPNATFDLLRPSTGTQPDAGTDLGRDGR
jgi:hypothetical protein